MKKILTILYITLLIGSPVQAQNTSTSNNPTGNNPLPQYNLLEPLPCIPSPAAKDAQGNTIAGSEVTCARAGATQSSINFKYYVQYLFNLLIALAAVASVFMIAYGGLQYMSTDSWGGKKEGLAKFKNAVLGLLLVLTSFIILRTIDPRLVEIPTTLVAPLNIKYESVSDGLLSILEKESELFRKSNTETKTKVEEAQKRNDERLARIAELKIKREEMLGTFGMGADETDPEIISIDAQIAGYQNQITREKADTYLLIDKLALDAEIYKFGSSSGTKVFNWREASSQIEKVYVQRYATLKNAGASPDQLQDLTNYKDYAKLTLEINEIVAKVVQSKLDYDNSFTVITTDANMNARIDEQRRQANDQLALIAQQRIFTNTDPVIKTKLLENVKNARAQLEKIKIE